MSDIFISYRRKDSWIMANLLYEKLNNIGYSVFLDTRNDKMLQTDYESVIDEHLGSIKDHIVLVSPESFVFRTNDEYLKEIECTSMREDVRKIPVIIEDGKQNTYDALLNCKTKCLRMLANKTITGFSNDSAAFPDTFKRIVDRLTSKPNRKETLIKSRQEIEKTNSLAERWANAEEICICAYGIESLLTQESPFFEQMISDGVKFKIVCVNPQSEAAKYIVDNNIREGTERERNRVIPNSHNLLLDYLEDEKYAKQIEYRLTSLRPESIIMITKRKQGFVNNVKVDFVVTSNDKGATKDNNLFSKTRRCIYIDDSDNDNYNYYNEVFDFIWNHSLTKSVEL